MKSINAKLFQTTGAIANLSVVEELIEKKYIETFMIDDSHKYCITSFGEEYCTSIYQE